MKKNNYSPEIKRRIAVAAALIIVFSATIVFVLKKPTKTGIFVSGGEHYELVKDYMQSQYTEAYSEFFEMAYVEGLSDYKENFNDETNCVEAEFVMNTYYKYPYRDPDTLPKVIEARENGNMQEYKRLYDASNALNQADYKLKIEAAIEEDALTDVKLYGDGEAGEWIYLENGLRDYITED